MYISEEYKVSSLSSDFDALKLRKARSVSFLEVGSEVLKMFVVSQLLKIERFREPSEKIPR